MQCSGRVRARERGTVALSARTDALGTPQGTLYSSASLRLCVRKVLRPSFQVVDSRRQSSALASALHQLGSSPQAVRARPGGSPVLHIHAAHSSLVWS